MSSPPALGGSSGAPPPQRGGLTAPTGHGGAPPGSPACPRPARIGAAVLGGDHALIAVATTAPDLAGATAQARAAGQAGADVVELRLDLLDGPEESAQDAGAEPAAGRTGAPAPTAPQDLAAFWHKAIGAVKVALGQWGTPLLATVRSAREGGGADLEPGRHAEALETLIALQDGAPQRRADAIDIELSTGALADLASRARAVGLTAVASSHDFAETPPSRIMLERLVQMEAAGADCAKIAVMPSDEADVERTLGVAVAARQRLEIPVVVISMGQLGRRSRLEGWRYGSALTFATVDGAGSAAGAGASGNASTPADAVAVGPAGAGVPSAPGQPTLTEVRAALA